MYRGLDTCFQQATEECERVHSWMAFFEDFLECLREKYPFLSLLLVKGRRGCSSCPKDWMGETFSPEEGETSVGGEVRHDLWAGPCLHCPRAVEYCTLSPPVVESNREESV